VKYWGFIFCIYMTWMSCNLLMSLSSRPLKSVNTWNRSPFWNTLSHEFSCRWRHLSCKLRPEIDNRFTFTLIKSTMRFKQIRKDIYRFWCQNGAISLLPFWLDNQSQIFPEKQSVVDNLHILCLFTFHCASWPIFTTLLGNGNCIFFILKLSNSLDNFQIFSGKLCGINMI
jgi:hypothetical protein